VLPGLEDHQLLHPEVGVLVRRHEVVFLSVAAGDELEGEGGDEAVVFPGEPGGALGGRRLRLRQDVDVRSDGEATVAGIDLRQRVRQRREASDGERRGGGRHGEVKVRGGLRGSNRGVTHRAFVDSSVSWLRWASCSDDEREVDAQPRRGSGASRLVPKAS
jgi:hypothetical protein